MEILGIDIGGSGMKAAITDTKTGRRLTDRHRIPTPKSGEPEAMAEVVHQLVKHFNWKTDVGCSFPAVIAHGKCYTAGNISPKWIGTQVDELFGKRCGSLKFHVANDADLAGLAEVEMGAGKNIPGKIITITVGTGLGSGVFFNGQLIPNIELGRVFHTNGKIIEKYAADSVRKRKDLKLSQWAKRFNFFLKHVEDVCRPDLFIIGGGISKKFDQFKDKLDTTVPVKPAQFRNYAGIVGAALYAAGRMERG